MDLSTMTFEEILFHGRYHLIGGLLLLIFVGGFVYEAVREALAVRAERRVGARRFASGPIFHDALVGPVMTDGGEPVEEGEEPDESA